jgi:hypothetical protein
MKWMLALLALALAACNQLAPGSREAPQGVLEPSKQECNQGALWVEFRLEQGTYRITQSAPGLEPILYESMPDVVGYGTRIETPQAYLSFERLEDGQTWTASVTQNPCL